MEAAFAARPADRPAAPADEGMVTPTDEGMPADGRSAVTPEDRPDCKGCTASVHDDSQIGRILAALARHPESCVDDDVYKARLAACRACPDLAYGTTCLHCGCFVAVRAKFRDRHCPSPGGGRWPEAG